MKKRRFSRFPDFSLGQAERPAIHPVAKLRAAARTHYYIQKGMIEITENRRRNETLSIRLTKAEKSAIITKARKAKMNLTEYILTISKNTKITLPPDTAPIVLELKRIGNNLNQIAAKVNSGVTYVENLTQVIENQNKIYDLLLKLTEECQWQR